MAAAVETGVRGVNYWGSQPIELVTIASWNNGDTCVTEFSEIKAAWFVPTTNASYGITITGTPALTVNLQSGGSLAGILFILG